MKLFKEMTADTVKASQVQAYSIPDLTGAAKTGLRSIWDTIMTAFK